MYSILLLRVISETKKLDWAFLQTVPLPTLKYLVQPVKTKHKNQTISGFLCCPTREHSKLDQFVFKTNQAHAYLHNSYIRGQNQFDCAPTCWSLSFSCRVRRCLLFFGPAGRCRAADDAGIEMPFIWSLSAPAASSRWAVSSWNSQYIFILVEVYQYMLLHK